MDVENILTAADKQIIVKHALDSIKANEHERSLPGSEHVSFIHHFHMFLENQNDHILFLTLPVLLVTLWEPPIIFFSGTPVQV